MTPRRSRHLSLRSLALAGVVASPIAFSRAAFAQDDTGDTTTTSAPETPPTTPPPSSTVPEYNGDLVAPIPTMPAPTTSTATTVPSTTPPPATTPGGGHVPESVPAPGDTTTTTTTVPTGSTIPGSDSTTSTVPYASPLFPIVQAPAGVTLAATEFDSIYANGLPIGVAMATSRLIESGNNYAATNGGSTASGAYQVIDSAWNNYGGYPRAYLAPPEVQDQFAYESFVAILKRNGNNLAAIPVSWYYPIALSYPDLMDTIPAPWAGNRLTIREYQTLWLSKFFELLGQGSPPFLPKETDPLIPSIAFPVLGPVQFWHDFGNPRGAHGERSHEGLDLIGTAGQPLRAAFDGTVTRIQVDPRGISGVLITVTRSDGVRANYFHVNDDTPGTTDGAAPRGLRIHPSVELGTTVKAGQIIAFMGDTGNAVGLPHLHFEIRTWDGIPIDPYPAVLAAQQREQCSVGIGPWSTDFVSPEEQLWFEAQFAAMSKHEQDVFKWVTASTPVPPLHTILVGPDGARWEVDEAGTVRAFEEAALIQPGSGACLVVPDAALAYGTGGAGVGRDLLPEDWWNTGVAYSGEVAGDDLLHGDGLIVGERPPELDITRW